MQDIKSVKHPLKINSMGICKQLRFLKDQCSLKLNFAFMARICSYNYYDFYSS